MDRLTVKISITQQHIENGNPAETCNCPVSRAITEYFQPRTPDKRGVANVGSARTVSYWHNAVRYPLDCINNAEADKLQAFLHAFDKRQPVQPINVELVIPTELQKLIGDNE